MNYEIRKNKNIQQQIEVEIQLQRMDNSIRVIENSKKFELIRLIGFTVLI